MRRFLLGLGALLAIVLVLVGVPAALIVVAGDPLPTWIQVHNVVTLVPDYGNVVLLSKVLPLLGWVAWLLFAVPLLVEMGAGIAGRRTAKRFWLLKGQQHAGAALVAAVLVMFAGFGGVHVSTSSVVAAPRPSPTFIEPVNRIPVATPVFEATVKSAAVTVSSEPVPLTQTVMHTVVPGENLWDISEKYYGVGTRDLDIFRASTATVQPGGRRLTNPNLIRPGWRLTVPNVPVPPTVASPAPSPGPPSGSGFGESDVSRGLSGQAGLSSPGSGVAVPPPSSSAQTAAPPAPTQSHPADRPIVAQADLAVPLTTAGGVVGLLAAGLLLVLGRRRLDQRRRRRAGERIAMPEPATADFEQELRMVADPLGVSDIDHALRLLQTHADDTGTVLPELLAVRLAERDISLYFIGAVVLPEPFEPLTFERTVWTFRPGTVTATSRRTVSPYPALVIIGVDDNEGVLLVDLEQLGVLNIIGDQDVGRGMLNALAVELAGNPWGEQIQVTLVGMPLMLPRTIDRFRVQHADHLSGLLRSLRGDLDERAAALGSYGVGDVHSARTLASESESWAPHIVVLSQTTEEPSRTQLAQMVATDGRLGLAVIAHGELDPGRATVRVEPSGRAELVLPGGTMPPLPFTPQLLRDRELELLQDLLDTTDKDAVEHAPIGEGEAIKVTVPESDFRLDGSQDDAGDPHLWMRAETEIGAPISERFESEQPASVPVPYLRLLGPVDAEGLNPAEPMPGRGVELMAYLLLRHGPVDGLQLQRAFWPDTPDAANNQRGLAKKVRVALGHNPSGELWLPENTNHHGYLLHPSIRSDWDDFRALVGDDPTTVSSDKLVAALHLVRGTPFAGCNTRRWWQWIAIPQEEMIAAIMDTADELGNRALHAQNASLARYAARIQQAVDPLNEAGWRIELRAALQTGDIDGFHTVLDDLYARVGGDDPDYDVDVDTQILIDRANQRIRA